MTTEIFKSMYRGQNSESLYKDFFPSPAHCSGLRRNFFDIDHNFIRNLSEVIKQRVQAQQHAQLVSFGSSIYFSDNRIQTLSSWEALDNFVDNSDDRVTKIELIWNYLVKFPSKSIPEKQSIAVIFDTGQVERSIQDKSQDSVPIDTIFKKFIKTMVLDNYSSVVSTKIDYSELTWGMDLLRHIESQVKNRIIVENSFLVMMREIFSFIGLAVLLPALVGTPVLLYGLFRNNYYDQSKAEFLLNNSNISDFQASVLARLNFLVADHIDKSPFNDPMYWLYLVCIASIYCSVMLFMVRRPKSYLLLNAASDKYKQDSESRHQKIKTSAFVVIALGIVSGVAATELSEFIKRLL
jgi:hypothetical protein